VTYTLQVVDSRAKGAARAGALDRLRKEHALRRLADLVRGNPRDDRVRWAVDEIARLDDMVATIRTPRSGTWRARGGRFQGPVEIGPFGRAVHRWSCLIGPRPGSTITLAYFGHSADKRARLVKVHAPPE